MIVRLIIAVVMAIMSMVVPNPSESLAISGGNNIKLPQFQMLRKRKGNNRKKKKRK
jgi:hypothetical protein